MPETIRTIKASAGMGAVVENCPWCGEELVIYDEAIGTEDFCHYCGEFIKIVNAR